MLTVNVCVSPNILILMQFCFFFADPPPPVAARNPPAPKTQTAPRNPTLPDGRHRHFCVVCALHIFRCSVAKFIVPYWGDKVDHGIELSYRPASLCSLRAGTRTLHHCQLYPPSQVRDYELGFCTLSRRGLTVLQPGYSLICCSCVHIFLLLSH
jgi:hypothetical protein